MTGSIYNKEWHGPSIVTVNAGEGGLLEGNLRRDIWRKLGMGKGNKKAGQSELLCTMHLLGLDSERTIIVYNVESSGEILWFWFNKYPFLLCFPPAMMLSSPAFPRCMWKFPQEPVILHQSRSTNSLPFRSFKLFQVCWPGTERDSNRWGLLNLSIKK